MTRHWVAWHAAYDDPTSGLSSRLDTVRTYVRDASAVIEEAIAGEIRS